MKSFSDLVWSILREEKLITEGSVNLSNLRQAIISKNKMEIYYEGDATLPSGTRVIHPYLYGLTIAGNPAVRAYQEQGKTKTITPGWKIFRLDRIRRVKYLRNDFFEINPQFRKDGNDKMFNKVYFYTWDFY
jgi:predicted DNA-binding transcriptional regulator YafY